MKSLKFYVFGLIAMLCMPYAINAQQGTRVHRFTIAGPDAAINLTNTSIAWHQISWVINGTASACTVALDTSTNGTTWTAGGAITGQTCTSNGSSSVVNVSAAFVRMDMTALSVSSGGYVTVTWKGWINNPGGGGGGSTSITGTSPVVVTPSPITGTGVISCPTCRTTDGTAFNVTNPPYNAVADGSTNNSTSLTAVFTASNAITNGTPSIYFPCQVGKQCQYNYTDGGTTSPINPTIASTIICDDGVILNDTGTAHMIDVGVGSGGYLKKFRITGCKFTGASVTAAIYLNAGSLSAGNFLEYGQIDHNTFYNLPTGSKAITGAGNIFNWSFDDNLFYTDNDVAGEFLDIGIGDGSDNQISAHRNLVYCSDAVTGLSGCTSAGAGIVINGVGSMVGDNYVLSMDPDYLVGVSGGWSHINGSNSEVYFSNVPIIQITGAPPNVAISNIYANMHSNGGPFIDGSTTLISNFSVTNNRIINITGIFIKQQQVNLQTGNQATGNTCGASSCYTTMHTLTGGGTPMSENWLLLDKESYSDGFTRSNGNLTAPWITYTNLTIPSITSNKVGCATSVCGATYSYDLPNNQRVGIQFGVVPTGTDAVGISSRTLETGGGIADYQCVYTAGTGIQLFKINNGTTTQLGSTVVVTPGVGDWMEVESIGTVQSCYLNGKPIISANDAVISVGYASIVIVGTSGTYSAFAAKGLP
jgi:hypothetical protein